MGQKVHPIGLRVGLYRKWKSNWFLDNTNYTDFLHLNFEINKYFAGILRNGPIKTFFSHCIIAKYSLEKIYIFVFFYRLRQNKRFKKRQKFFKLNKNINKSDQNLLISKQNKNKLLNLITIFYNFKLNYNNNEININNTNNYYKSTPINLLDNKFNMQRGTYKSINTIKLSLQNLIGTKTHLTFINLLSFVKFYLYNNNNIRLIDGIQKQLTNFYKYDVKLLKDAINIFFITIILKQPQTLATFISYQLRRTPKNRHHGKLIQFYKKLAIIALAQQKEIIGLHIKFKGRINGRRRKRHTTIKIGELPLQSYDSYIEYGHADAITIYGTIGVKVWIYYNKSFNLELQKYFLKYLYKTKNIK